MDTLSITRLNQLDRTDRDALSYKRRALQDQLVFLHKAIEDHIKFRVYYALAILLLSVFFVGMIYATNTI